MSRKITAAMLRSIRVLYRQDDTLALWGIPYDMRPGQGPKDILPRFRDHWIWLGSPGWWGSYSRVDQRLLKAYLRAAGAQDAIPQNPHEWSRLSDFFVVS